MGKPTNTATYRFGSDQIEIMPYFLYEICKYEITKNTAYLIESKYIKSDKLLSFKKNNLFINLLGAPIEFIQDNRLPIYTLKKK